MGLDPSAAQNTRGVVDIPIPDFSGQRAGAEALDSVGKAMLEFGNKLQKEKEDHDLVKADADMRVRMDKARQVIELDPETPDAAIPQRWKQESELIIKEVGGGISSSRARELWEIRARGVQGEGDVWSQNLLRKRQVDKVGSDQCADFRQRIVCEVREQRGDPAPRTYADTLRAQISKHGFPHFRVWIVHEFFACNRTRRARNPSRNDADRRVRMSTCSGNDAAVRLHQHRIGGGELGLRVGALEKRDAVGVEQVGI